MPSQQFSCCSKVFHSPWYYSSLLGLLSVTEWLFQNGAELRKTFNPDWYGYNSALQAASAEGHVSIVRYLLEKNFAQANEGPEFGDHRFHSPLEAASSRGHLRI